MKILHVQNVTGIAGSENYLLQIIPELINRGHEVSFLCLHPKGNKDGYNIFKTKLEEARISSFHTVDFTLKGVIKVAKKINQIVDSNSFDIIHTHLIHADFLLAVTKRIYKFKFPIVSTKHGYEEWYNNKYGFDPSFKTKNLYYYTAKFAEKYISKSFAISKGLFNLYVGLGICRKEDTSLIYYGFDFPNIEEDSSKRFATNQLVMVGRLTSFKGHRYALEAVKILKNRISEFKLVIVGAGELDSELKQLAENLGVSDKVDFLGYQPNGRSFMKASDIVLIPSISEGFGVVVLEAFNTEKPIVSFDVPSLNEHIINRENGILINPYSIEEYANAIEKLVRNKELAISMGKSGKKKLEKDYTLDRMVNETLSFYSSIVSS